MAAKRIVGLSDDHVAQLRDQLRAGRRPRVRVSGVQFPESTVGTVIRVGEPDVDGKEFVTVRVKVAGITDDLGFSPGELSVAGRKAAAPAPPPARAPAPVPASAPVPAPAPARVKASATRPVAVPVTRPAPGPGAHPPVRRSGPVPAVTVTIASAGTTWSVTAQRGARFVVKKVQVPPGVVSAIAVLLKQPDIDEAVAAVNDSARGEAEARAEKLRAELAEVEAVLVSHRRP